MISKDRREARREQRRERERNIRKEGRKEMKEGRKEKEMVFLESNKFEFQTHFLALC